MGIDVLDGHASFTGSDRLDIDGRSIGFRAAVVATGSTPVVPDALADAEPLTTDTVWDELEDLPGRLTVVGGGATGCELSQAFARLGHDVILIEAAERLLREFDADVGAAVARQLSADGVEVLRGTSVTGASPSAGGTRLKIGSDRDALAVDRVIVAVGRHPVTDGLELPAAGVQTDTDGVVIVDDTLRTTTPNIFAAGDVVGGPNLTHLAAHHGATAAANGLFLLRRTVQRRAVPTVVYTDPEIAHVGVTAERARRRLPDAADVIDLRFDEIDRAITDGRTDGWVRLIAARGRLVGATIVAPHAGESIAALADVVRRRGSIGDVAATMHPYPTYSIAAYQAAARHRLAGLAHDRVRTVTGLALDVLRTGADLRRGFTLLTRRLR
ncbi:MAG: FAD-dependent oxidoreductase [Actinobacteria bacterium]|nr:FAD-dependent oxidoreductase [Actinomycetota bacterium]